MMNKKEFTNLMAEEYGISKVEAKASIDRFIDCTKLAVEREGGLSLQGFFQLKMVDRPEREHLDPQTGDKVVVASGKDLKGKFSKAFRQLFKTFDY